MRLRHPALAAFAAALVVLSACSPASDSSSVAVGPGTPVPTTPPFAIPPVLRQPDAASSGQTGPVATTAPVEAQLPATGISEADVPLATSMPLPTLAPTTQPSETTTTTETTPESATAAPATEVPATSEPTAAPATAVPATAAPTTEASSANVVPASPHGPTIALGDFDVVNLVTGATQNIAELSPSGATMLWFWAPH